MWINHIHTISYQHLRCPITSDRALFLLRKNNSKIVGQKFGYVNYIVLLCTQLKNVLHMEEKQIDDEIIDEVKRVINYQTNIGWGISIVVGITLFILNHYKII